MVPCHSREQHATDRHFEEHHSRTVDSHLSECLLLNDAQQNAFQKNGIKQNEI